jgi:hypothetical protein
MPRKQTPIQARKSAIDSDYTPLYAVAGLTDALAEALRGALVERQERATRKISELQSRRPDLGRQARENVDELRTFVITLPEAFRNLPESTRARIAELQQQANDLLAQAETTYGEMAGRGKRVVDEAIGSARDLTAKAERRTADVASDAADRLDPAFEKVQEGVTTARRSTTGRSATESVTPRPAAKASATRKASAAKKVTEQTAETPVKKTPAAKKITTAKKAPATGTTAKKAERTPAKKATVDAS